MGFVLLSRDVDHKYISVCYEDVGDFIEEMREIDETVCSRTTALNVAKRNVDMLIDFDTIADFALHLSDHPYCIDANARKILADMRLGLI